MLSVSVDGMKIIQDFNISKKSDGVVGLGSYDAKAEFSEINILPFEEKKCLIIMPFDRKRDLLYDYFIKPTLDKHPYFVFNYIGGDEALTAGKICEEITEFIEGADILLADVTIPNPNVFYELGFAYARSCKALLLLEELKGETANIPFDIQDFRCHIILFRRMVLNLLVKN
jgi:hypothetical protein